MQYLWIKIVADMSPDNTIIDFHDNFNQRIEPGYLPENLTTITFGSCFNQKIELGTLPDSITNIKFGYDFNQEIFLNVLPKNLTNLTFGCNFNQRIVPNSLPENLTTITFGFEFNQRIVPNGLPKNLTTINFDEIFNQKIESEMLPPNLFYINFDWVNLGIHYPIEYHIEMINNICSHYCMKILLVKNIFNDNGPKWPIHVVDYTDDEWSPDIYGMVTRYLWNGHQIFMKSRTDTKIQFMV